MIHEAQLYQKWLVTTWAYSHCNERGGDILNRLVTQEGTQEWIASGMVCSRPMRAAADVHSQPPRLYPQRHQTLLWCQWMWHHSRKLQKVCYLNLLYSYAGLILSFQVWHMGHRCRRHATMLRLCLGPAAGCLGDEAPRGRARRRRQGWWRRRRRRGTQRRHTVKCMII